MNEHQEKASEVSHDSATVAWDGVSYRGNTQQGMSI